MYLSFTGLCCLPMLCAVKLFGCSAAAQVKTSRETKGQFLSVNMAFSVGVMSAMYLTKNISGKQNEASMASFSPRPLSWVTSLLFLYF